MVLKLKHEEKQAKNYFFLRKSGANGGRVFLAGAMGKTLAKS